MPVAQADVTRHAREMPIARRSGIASYPYSLASPAARKRIALARTSKTDGQGNADRWEPSRPRQNQAEKVGTPRLDRQKGCCQPLHDFCCNKSSTFVTDSRHRVASYG